MRNLERAAVPRSVAMQLTGHKTESIYRRYAIVAEADLRDGAAKLAAFYEESGRGEEPGQNRDNPPHAGTSDGFADTGAISWCANELQWNGQGQNRTADTRIFSPLVRYSDDNRLTHTGQ